MINTLMKRMSDFFSAQRHRGHRVSQRGYDNFNRRWGITKCFQLSWVICFCLAACESGDRADGQRVEWGHVGAGGGGAQFCPTVSPHDPKTVFVTCDMGGSFVTYDGGESWRMFNLSHRARFFVFDPVDPDVVYAQTYALFRSADKGQTWHLFYPKPSDVSYVVSRGDHASESCVLKDSTSRSIQVLAIDPEQSKNMYAMIRINQSRALYSSVDGGEEWNREQEFDQDIRNIFIDPSSPSGNRTLYLTWSGGVEQRSNGQWHSYGLPEKNVKFNLFSGGYDAANKQYILYALSGKGYLNSTEDTDLGIYVSNDGGKTWQNRQDGLLNYCVPDRRTADFQSIATCELNPATVYVSYSGMAFHADTIYIGVAKSEDYGKTWTLPWKEDGGGNNMSNYSGCWLNDRFGASWGGSPFSMGVAPKDANVCYGTDFGRTVKTENGGQTWEAPYTRQLSDGSWTTRGIEVTTGYDVVFDPFDKDHIFLALTDIGLMESKNGGKGWLSATRNGVPRRWVNTTYWMVFDPEVKGRAWAAMSGIHDLPVPKMFQRSGVANYTGGITRTNDGAATWQAVSESIGEAAMTHILLDPTSKKDARTLYACAFGKGVYKSTDGGSTWEQKNKGIEGAEPFAWRIERRESDGTLFLIASRRSWDGSIGTDWDGALYRSADGAETWTKMTLPEGCNGPTSLVATPKNPKRLVLSAWGRVIPNRYASDRGGGIFISEDDGKTWMQTMEKDQHIYAVSFDPRNNRYYACGFNASVYFSEDDAQTWNRSKGYNFKWGHRVIPDPRDKEMIFVVTFGGGVWHGPAKGDPDAIEDLITPIDRR